MRDLAANIITAKNAADQRTFWLVDIFLKAGAGYVAETLRLSTQAVQYNSQFYEPRLKSKPQIRQTLGTATDGGTVKIDNTDLGIGAKFLAKDKFTEGSIVDIYFAWKLPDGTVVADKVFDGQISGSPLSMADSSVNLSLTGDLYQQSIVLGAFPLAQRCVLEFNINGILSAEVSPCGWQTIQGGNPLFCDKTEDGADGCAAHHNLHRIGAIPFFANVPVQIVGTGGGLPGSGSGGNSSGFSDTYPCFVNESLVLLPDFSEMPIGEFAVGGSVMSFNEKTGKLVSDEVIEVHIHRAKGRYILAVEFADGEQIRVTPEHPAYIDFGKFVPVGELTTNNFINSIVGTSFADCRWKASEIVKITKSFETVEVRNLSVKENKTFIVGHRGWHNVKPAYSINF